MLCMTNMNIIESKNIPYYLFNHDNWNEINDDIKAVFFKTDIQVELNNIPSFITHIKLYDIGYTPNLDYLSNTIKHLSLQLCFINGNLTNLPNSLSYLELLNCSNDEVNYIKPEDLDNIPDSIEVLCIDNNVIKLNKFPKNLPYISHKIFKKNLIPSSL